MAPNDDQFQANDAYSRAGVDIAAGNAAVARYKDVLGAWRHPDQLDAIGGFGGLFKLPGDGEKALVASTDGVGTKILIAAELQRYDGVGRDLVNHCVNDILVVNATPLFFLDYYAVGKLTGDRGGGGARLRNACRATTARCSAARRRRCRACADTSTWLGRSSIVDRANVPKPETVVAGDAIVGCRRSDCTPTGTRSRARGAAARGVEAPFEGGTYADALLAEHPSYLKEVRAIQAVANVKTMAHITGGGLLENVPRTLPAHAKAIFEQSRWSVPPIMRELVKRGNLTVEERYRTLNMGVGYTMVVPLADAPAALAAVPGAMVVGWIEKRDGDEAQVVVHPARPFETLRSSG